ncbi:hypothetical protein COCON_G00057820 [Conger conger]|uniref:Uncharacterized protein n=1 Tax=Conger conger TaxID=82655 RepID=A0A9Q1DQV9_CONCO|nr:protein FAM174C [Conger conger]KAJ8278716.1 hypothetical protein COCON_G00057820 [Conger conger]
MQLPSAYIFIAVCILWILSLSSATDTVTKSPTTAVPKELKLVKLVNNTNNVSHNVTNGYIHRNHFLNMDSSTIQRALYVLIGITIIGVFYFLIRAVRLKKTSSYRKKYGLLSNQDTNMEMGNLESDEEDMTVYEAKALRR